VRTVTSVGIAVGHADETDPDAATQ
jgi:hypothetical protein